MRSPMRSSVTRRRTRSTAGVYHGRPHTQPAVPECLQADRALISSDVTGTRESGHRTPLHTCSCASTDSQGMHNCKSPCAVAQAMAPSKHGPTCMPQCCSARLISRSRLRHLGHCSATAFALVALLVIIPEPWRGVSNIVHGSCSVGS